jgi:hypothetical protein
MLFIAMLVIGALFGWSMGRTSNGMTSPRQSFNIFTGPFAAVICAVLGLIVGIFTGGVGAAIGTSFLGGLIGGLCGLGAARLTRGR